MKDLINFFFFRLKKKCFIGLVNSGGRNFLGRITVFHRGGGKKFSYIYLDRFRRLNQYGCVYKVLKVRNFSSFIGLILYDNGLASFILLSAGLFVGSKVFSGVSENIKGVG
jgi:large subunit ribosomal protein L2